MEEGSSDKLDNLTEEGENDKDQNHENVQVLEACTIKIEGGYSEDFSEEQEINQEFATNYKIEQQFEDVIDPLNIDFEFDALCPPATNFDENENQPGTSDALREELLLSNFRTLAEESVETDTNEVGETLYDNPVEETTSPQSTSGSQIQIVFPPVPDPNNVNNSNNENWRTKHRSHRKKLAHLLKTPGMNQDVVFIVGLEKEKIYAHSFIIWINSPAFQDILFPSTSTNTEIKEIVLSDISPAIFKIILKYMYTEEIHFLGQNVEDVYRAAKQIFRTFELSNLCVELIKNNISVQNVIGTFKLAKEFEEETLFEESFSFITQNAEQILSSPEFLILNREDITHILGNDNLNASENAVFQSAIRWAENLCFQTEKKPSGENIREALDQVIYKIRFPLLTAEEFKLMVVPANVLQPTEVIELFNYFTPPFQKVRSDFPFSTTPRIQQSSQNEVDNTNVSTMNDSASSPCSSSDLNKPKPPINTKAPSTSRTNTRSQRGRGRPPKKIDQKPKVIKISSSSGESSSSEEDDWKKSSDEDSDSSADPPFKPPSHLKRKLQPPVPNMLPINNKRCKLLVVDSEQASTLLKSNPIGLPDLNILIDSISAAKSKSKILKIQEDCRIISIPKIRVTLPNLKEFYLNLTSPALNRKPTATEFKSVASPFLAAMSELIFIDNLEIKNNMLINKFALEKLWNSGMKVTITLNGVTALKLNPERGQVLSTFTKFPALGKIFEGLRLRKDSVRHLTLSECEFRLFNTIPTLPLNYLSIVKATGLQGLAAFLKCCINLQEFYFDGIGAGTWILYIDEDLRLFSPYCKLKKLVISNMTIGLKNSKIQGPSKVTTPIFYFCEFSPFVIQQFTIIFPELDQIHFRNYPALPFMESIIDLDSIKFVGVWGAKLMTQIKLKPNDPNNACVFMAFLSHQELKTHIKKGNILNKVGSFISHGFFIRKTVNPHFGGIRWTVKESVRNPYTGLWDEEFLKQIYDDFQYASFLNFTCFQNLFRSYY